MIDFDVTLPMLSSEFTKSLGLKNETRSYRRNHHNPKFSFQSKVMMRKLLEITEISTLLKNAEFPNYEIYRSQLLITKIGYLNKDCGTVSRYYL